jgi:hypothetical protein
MAAKVDQHLLEWARNLQRNYYALKRMESGDSQDTPVALAAAAIKKAQATAQTK